MGLYIQLSILRINLVLLLGLAGGACGAEPRAGVSRVWPELGTMMSAAAWVNAPPGADSARLVRALNAAHESVDRIDSLLQQHVRIAAIDSARRDVWQRTGVMLIADSIMGGYALDRAALALAPVVDSALLDIGGQFYWIAPPARPTNRRVGIPDPDNTLRVLAGIEMRSGAVSTRSQRNAPPGRARSVTVLAADGLTANAWAAALLELGCDRALTESHGMSVVCADSAGVRWTTDLQNRVSLPIGRAP